MDAVDFLKEAARMCNTFCDYGRKGCGDCPMEFDGLCLVNKELLDTDEKIVDLVEKWSKDHPIKIRIPDDLKPSPYAGINMEDYLAALPTLTDILIREELRKIDFSCEECRKLEVDDD